MNVLYLHGLESKPTGPKMKYLRDRFENFYAPEIDYEEYDAFNNVLDLCNEKEIDVVIGSSMGGYFACSIGTIKNIPVVVFNPALHSREIDPFGVETGQFPLDGIAALGMSDTVIDPIETYKMLENHEQMAIMAIKGMGHRIPITTFINVIEKALPPGIK